MKRLGRYEVLTELGHGAMGRVYLGLDPQIGREVALKTVNIFQLDPSLHEEFCKRFFHEAQAAGRLLHPGIVTLFDVGEDPATNTPFLVMEYVEGSTLDVVMSEHRCSTSSALQVAKEIAEALDFAHAHGIVHRDIKPSNILLTREGRAKITDFGVARLPAGPATDTGAVLGTPQYMSPEQLGGKRVDGRTDLFALGTILYRLLTGFDPFPGDSLSTVFFKIMFTDPAPVGSLDPQLGPDFDYVLNRALAKEPVRRYQNGQEFAADLEDLHLGAPPRSRAALRKSMAEEAKVAIPPPAPPIPDSNTKHPKTPTVKTEPMSSWPLVVTTLRLFSFSREATRPTLLVACALMVVAVAAVNFSWQLNASKLESAAQAGLQTSAFVAPIPSEDEPVATWARTSAPAKPPGGPGTLLPHSQAAAAGPKPTQGGLPRNSPATNVSGGGGKAGAAQKAAMLFVVGEHSFREATMHFYADDEPVGQVELTSREGERARFSTSLPVRPGSRTLTVIAKDANGGFDQKASIDGEFGSGRSRHLEARISRRAQSFWMGKKLTLRWLDSY